MPKDHQPSTNATAQKRDSNDTAVTPSHVATEQPSPAVPSKPEPTSKQAEAKNKALPWFKEVITKPDWVMVFITAIYVIFTGWILIVMKRQAGDARDGASRTLKSINDQIDLMRRQADTMDRQVSDARTSASESAVLAQSTLGAIEKQAQLMAHQINLQERAMAQWVNYGNWHSELIPDGDNWFRLVIHLNVENPTSLPLTLQGAKITVWVGDGCWSAFGFRESHILRPNNPYKVDIGFSQITQDKATQFEENALVYRVDGDLSHVGALGKRQEQMFCGYLFCGRSGTRFEEDTPRAQGQPNSEQKCEQNAN